MEFGLGPDGSRHMIRIRHQMATCAVAFLLGLGIAVHLNITAAFLWGLEGDRVLPVLLPTLGWASVGAWLPHRLLAGLLRGLWKKVAGGRALREDLMVLRPRRRSHRVLLWLIMAAVASMIGLAELLVMVFNGWAGALGAYLQEHFLWTTTSWFVARMVLRVLILLLPGLLMGMAVAGLGSLSSAHDDHHTRGPLPVLIIGGGVGTLVLRLTTSAWLVQSTGFLLVSRPFFLTSWVAGLAATWVEKETEDTVEEVVHVPVETTRDRYVIASGLGVWGALTTLWITGQSGGQEVQMEFLGGIGVGAAVGEWWLSDRHHSRSGAGMGLWALGVASAIGIVCWGGDPPQVGPTGKRLILPLVSSVVGFLLPYLLRCLTSRYTTAGRSHSLATSLLTGAAAGVMLAAYLLPEAQRTWVRLLAIFSLLAIALGGLLVIHDEQAPPRPRRNRLILIFGSLVFLMGLFAWSSTT